MALSAHRRKLVTIAKQMWQRHPTPLPFTDFARWVLGFAASPLAQEQHPSKLPAANHGRLVKWLRKETGESQTVELGGFCRTANVLF
jgi:hypothetical protein